jgi:hypothetical protein
MTAFPYDAHHCPGILSNLCKLPIAFAEALFTTTKPSQRIQHRVQATTKPQYHLTHPSDLRAYPASIISSNKDKDDADIGNRHHSYYPSTLCFETANIKARNSLSKNYNTVQHVKIYSSFQARRRYDTRDCRTRLTKKIPDFTYEPKRRECYGRR